eukprot:1779186-Alexandrium_andersonii.AAC.1
MQPLHRAILSSFQVTHRRVVARGDNSHAGCNVFLQGRDNGPLKDSLPQIPRRERQGTDNRIEGHYLRLR